MMSVVFGCPGCGRGIELQPGRSGTCRRCGAEASLPGNDGELTACLACPCEELYKHRDFNAKLGIFMIALGAVLCLVLSTFWPLVIAAAVDLVLFLTIGNVAICYRCKAHHREFDNVGALPAFDLERHEHYRFVKAREEGLLDPRQE